MKIFFSGNTFRLYFGSFVLLMLVASGGSMSGFRTAAANGAADDAVMPVALKSQNTPALNFHPGRDLPMVYSSGDNSADNLRAGQNRPLALASTDFDVDGFPDLVAGYAAPNGNGIVTFHKGNPEAFAPQSTESFAGISEEGRFPDPFLKNAESFNIPVAPDFLVTGDFDRDGNPDVIVATRGGDKIYLLSGTGRDGGFNAAQEINLPGRVTALTAGEIDVADNRADLVIGLEGDGGASLLVFEDAENGVFGAAVNYGLATSAIALELGKLDADLLADAAILTGDGISILHGRNSREGVESPKSGAARLEKINLPFVPQALTIGNFIWNRAGKTHWHCSPKTARCRLRGAANLTNALFQLRKRGQTVGKPLKSSCAAKSETA